MVVLLSCPADTVLSADHELAMKHNMGYLQYLRLGYQAYVVQADAHAVQVACTPPPCTC